MSEPMAYIGRAECGCIKAACVDEPDVNPRKSVNDFMKHGLTIERVTCEYVRQNMRRCLHEKQEER